MRLPRHSALLPHPSRRRHPCCALQAQPVPTTARLRQATRPRLLHRRDTTRPRRRLNSTLPPRPATRPLVPTTAQPLPTCTELALLLLHTLLPLPLGLPHLPRLTRPRVPASPRALGRNNLPPAPATRPLLPHFLPGPLARELLETNIHLIPRLTTDFPCNAHDTHSLFAVGHQFVLFFFKIVFFYLFPIGSPGERN